MLYSYDSRLPLETKVRISQGLKLTGICSKGSFFGGNIWSAKTGFAKLFSDSRPLTLKSKAAGLLGPIRAEALVELA
ncbi:MULTISPECIES: hypothetical protein [Pseudomonas]|uniref:hypothetical protein n=1 Tax=Pseudomonas TaxID=286 RepID=UPI002B406A8D|nr:hypothetical protein [Pseudomonas sichuanensis]